MIRRKRVRSQRQRGLLVVAAEDGKDGVVVAGSPR